MDQLGQDGQALYDHVSVQYDLEPQELQVLSMACRATDELSLLESQLPREDVMIVGSTGQPRVHPLFAEVRATRSLIASLLGQLKVREENPAQSRSAGARKAAGARWNH